MLLPKQVLVVTTSGLDNHKIINYLKPVSAHVVAGTNVFTDWAASFSDFFGGRSGAYQRQLSSIYDEAIERLKIAAFEIGANCVLGLKVDIDEISGKNKAMFMITAVGTAAVFENTNRAAPVVPADLQLDIVSVEKINTLKKKHQVLRQISSESTTVEDENWNFISDNLVEEALPLLVKKYKALMANLQVEIAKEFLKRITTYLSQFPEEKIQELVYNTIFNEADPKIARDLSVIVHELRALDLKLIQNVLIDGDFEKQKKVVRLVGCDKSFYDREDLADFARIKGLIIQKFPERGTRTTKKQLLSSKEKDIWMCTCGGSADIGERCGKCGKDIYGLNEGDPVIGNALNAIDQKIGLISHFIS
jgi:uncharacterized protein YbjQ (UPF0145 family)